MKTIRLICLVICLTSCSTWSKETKIIYGAAVATQAVDFLQTHEILKNDNFNEMNPLITAETFETYIISVNTLILIAAHFMPDDYRKMLFSYITGAEVVSVWHNYELGISP